MGLENDNVQVKDTFTLNKVLGELNPNFRDIIRSQIQVKNSGKYDIAVAQVIPAHFAVALKKVEICLSELRALYVKEESKKSLMARVEWTVAEMIALKMKSIISPETSSEYVRSGHVSSSSYDNKVYVDCFDKLASIERKADFKSSGHALLSGLLKALSVIASITHFDTKLKEKCERQKNKSTKLYELGRNVSLFQKATTDFDKQPSQLSNSLNLK